MKYLRQYIRRLLNESIDYNQYIDNDMDFEGLINQINLLLNATANPGSWKQVEHANTEMFIFIEPRSNTEWDLEEPWYIPWHNLKDAFENAGIPNYHDLSLYQLQNLKGPAWYTEIKKSRTEGGRKIPQINIFHLMRPK